MKYKLVDDGFQFRLVPEGSIIDARKIHRFPKESFRTKEDVLGYWTTVFKQSVDDIII